MKKYVILLYIMLSVAKTNTITGALAPVSCLSGAFFARKILESKAKKAPHTATLTQLREKPDTIKSLALGLMHVPLFICAAIGTQRIDNTIRPQIETLSIAKCATNLLVGGIYYSLFRYTYEKWHGYYSEPDSSFLKSSRWTSLGGAMLGFGLWTSYCALKTS